MFIRIYKCLIRILYPLVIKRYINKRKQNGKEDINRFNERIGCPEKPRPEGKLIWFHGASVGESLSMLPLITRLLELYPNIHIMVTTGTVTSADVMGKRLPERAFHQYIPIDNPAFTTKFLRHWKPDLVLWFESDLWPSMLSGIKSKKIPLLLVNGRISNKSFKRWQQFDFICKELLDCFTLCIGQSDEDARRLQVLGAKDAICLGNLKYAGFQPPVDPEKRKEIATQIGNRPLWNVSSTHHNEELQIGKFLKRIEEKVPGLLTIIAPRHPNRGPEIQDELNNLGLKTALRSKGEKITDEVEVYIADTIGEVGIWYDLSPLVFIGGSLIPHGGQNFMEPSRMRDAVVVGPHMFNFTDAMNRAQKAEAVTQVNDAQELEAFVLQMLTEPELLEKKRNQAYEWAHSEAKVLDGIVDKVKGYIGE